MVVVLVVTDVILDNLAKREVGGDNIHDVRNGVDCEISEIVYACLNQGRGEVMVILMVKMLDAESDGSDDSFISGNELSVK